MSARTRGSKKVSEVVEETAQEKADREIAEANEAAIKENAAKLEQEALDKAAIDAINGNSADVKDDAADKKDEEKVVVVEEVAPATSHPMACDPVLFGTCDPQNNDCRNCLKDFADCYEACHALKVWNNRSRGATASTNTNRAPRQRAEGSSPTAQGVPAINGTGSTAQIYNLMARNEGATWNEMLACRKDTGKPQAVKDGALRKLISAFRTQNGANVVNADGKWYIRAAVAA